MQDEDVVSSKYSLETSSSGFNTGYNSFHKVNYTLLKITFPLTFVLLALSKVTLFCLRRGKDPGSETTICFGVHWRSMLI